MVNRRELASLSSAMSDTFTHSRSEIILHRPRSDQSRLDPKRHHPAPTPPHKDPPHKQVKDLGLKRVFSNHKAKIKINDRVDEKRSKSNHFKISMGYSDDSGEYSMHTTLTDLDMGISPCSRSKFITYPGSISYRRMLPFLKKLENDDSSGVEIFEVPMKKIKLLNPSSEQKNHYVSLGDFPMAKSGGNHDSDKNPVRDNPSLNSQEQIVHMPIKVESPNSCSESKLQSPEVTSKVGFNDHNMDKLNRQEKEGIDKDRYGSDTEILKVSNDCSGDTVQSTPPNDESTRKLDGAEFGSGRIISEPAVNNTSKNSLGLVSCSRSKLYQNPSSFSYRRLLPYLMDLAKNGSSGMEIIDSGNCTTKVENGIKERPSMLHDIPLPRQQHQTVPVVDSAPVHLREDEDSEANHVSQSPGLYSQGDAQNPATTELANSCYRSKAQDLNIASEAPLERSDFEFELCKSSSYTPTIHKDLSLEELSGNVLELSHSPMETDRRPNKEVPQFDAFGHGANQLLAPRKGILKRQSRGCEGICMCLDCASFCVHAKRAYEFSRRQMLDDDEAIERLMKELSCLRNLLERSVPIVNGVRSYTIIKVSQEQVNGVCQRALGVEEQVRSRTRQMFCDLNTHCRIPGPRVTFSDYVDARSIP